MGLASEATLKRAGLKAHKKIKDQLILFGVLFLVFILFNIILKGRFLTFNNVRIIVSHAVFPAFLAWGMSFIFSGGLIDLSIGATVLLSANVGAVLSTQYHLGYFGLILGAVASAIILEHLSVRCSVSLGIPSWIAGLGMALIYEAILSQYATMRAPKYGSSTVQLDSFRALGQMPYMAILFILGFIAAYLLLNRTTIGINIRAIGENLEVAQSMGVNRKKTLFLGALLGSIFIGFAAVVQISFAGKLNPSSGLSSLQTMFKALAIILLAQSFSRVISIPVGILIGSIVVMGIFNILTLFGVPSGTGQEMFLGGIVILCGIISQLKYKGVVK